MALPRKRAQNGPAPSDGSAQGAGFYSISEGVIDQARQDYIDALPVAAAVLCWDQEGRSYIDIANQIFACAASWDPSRGSRWIDQIDFFSETRIGAELVAFLEGGEKNCQFEGQDDRSFSRRYYVIRAARLRPTAYASQRCLLSLIDKTAQIETEMNLRAEMLRDSLSGLPNRLAFTEQLEAALNGASREAASHAVLVVNMARFSRVNECAGAMAGDELLITFARRLFSALRPGDLLARTGGDEFGILVRLGKGVEDALNFAERITALLAEPFRLSGMEIRVDCAIGCAVSAGLGTNAEELLRNAQFASKRAKSSGRIQLYRADEAREAVRRFSLETELRRAIEADQLDLVYQPLIELSSGAPVGVEALARWTGPDGPVSPDEFIPVAEESGLIVPLGRWAIVQALKTLAEWDRKAGRRLPLYMSVNLSAVQIQKDDVPRMVKEALALAQIEGTRLMIELTETAIVHDPAAASAVLESLKQSGIRIALDDFGSGYTSLAHLQRLPIDLLKIDGGFVGNMLEDPDSSAIVRAIQSLAGSLGLETTAEGVDCEGLVHILTGLGCSNGQGYHLSAPLEAPAALDYLLSRSA